jgi:hypothetical protein
MPYNHNENIKELYQTEGIQDAFNYAVNDPYKVVEQYFQFCQENLSEECGEFNIQPARIYIRKDTAVNGYATRTDNQSIIAVNFGTIVTLFRFFTDNRSIFEKDELKEFYLLYRHFNLDVLAFQITTQFTYYHELAHLIQRSPIANQWIGELYARYIKEGDGYSLKRHLYEFDADLFGSGHEAIHIIDYWKKLPADLKTPDHLGQLLSLGAGAIFSYFLFLMEKYANIYYKAGDHPHPIVRISYMVDNFIRNAAHNCPEGVQLNAHAILTRAFQIAEHWFSRDHEKTKAVNEFAKFFENEGQNIADYINNVLIPESKTLKELVMNRPQKK